MELAWNDQLSLSWRTALVACAKAAHCLLRTVPENLRQAAARPYADFARRVAPIAAEASAAVVDSFPGTWTAAQLGLVRHHDSTRIHFSDTGRAFLAQLTLNAMPLILPPLRSSEGGTRRAALPANELAGQIALARLVPARRRARSM